MKELIGKSGKLEFLRDGKRLFFYAKIISSITDTHITFVDRYDEVYSFKIEDLEEVNDVH